MEYTEIKDLYNKSKLNPKPALEYLINERKINPNLLQNIGYLESLQHAGKTLYDIVVIPIFDSNNKISMLECRTIYHKQYAKITHSKTRIPLLLDWHKLNRQQPTIIVEGVIEALSLKTFSDKLQVCSTLRASASRSQLHYLKWIFNELVLILNNDSAGIDNAERIIEFYNNTYSYNPYTEDCYAEDLNQLLQDNPNEFKDFVRELERSYCD